MTYDRGADFPTSGVATVDSPPLSAAQRDMVREQLGRILASALFRNSKRFPEFLRYTVNRVLNDDTEHIKERTIGIEVFGRDASYDTSVDPVVRVTAGEVRKRLTQYYQSRGADNELRIEFARGSYVPEFIFPEEKPFEVVLHTAVAQVPVRQKHRKTVLIWSGLALVCIALCAFVFGVRRPTARDRFWSPIAESKAAVLLCIPGRPLTTAASLATNQTRAGAATAPETPSVAPVLSQVSFSDSLALSELSGILGGMGKDFHVRYTQDSTLDDLKQGPVVLIGGFSNSWTMRLDDSLRYDFVRDGSQHYISDRENPTSRAWQASDSFAGPGPATDYALLSRVLDATTGNVLITVAGIRRFGTQAAADCLVDSSCIESAEKLAPGDWKRGNIQIVLATPVIAEHPGQPRVLAAYVW